MTGREFTRLVTSCDALARRSWHAYLVRLFLLAILGYAYIAAVLLVLGAAAAALVWVVSGSSAGIATLQLALPLAGAVWIVLRALRVELPAVRGIELTRSMEPRLFAEIDRVRGELRAPRIDRVILDNEFNAAVAQYPRWGPFGQRNVLLLGLTLLSTLTIDEFRAVLAHELGHVAGGHGRFSIWIYRIRTRWMQLLDAVTGTGHWSAFLYRRFFEWYSPYFHAYSLVLTRRHELDADRVAVGFAGAQALVDGLARKVVTDRFMESRFQPAARRLPARRPDPPADFPSLLRQAAGRAFESPAAEDWLRQAMAGTTHVADSHPSLMDRVRSAGLPAPDPAAWCRRLSTRDPEPGEILLDSAADHALRLAEDWQEAIGPVWAAERERYARMRAELAAIDEGGAGASPDFVDLLRRAELIALLEGPREAVDRARSLVATGSGSAEADFLLAGLLAEMDELEAIEHLERAMRSDPALTRSGLAIGRALLRRLGRDADALAFEQRWESAASESIEGVWTSPMSDADRVRIRAAQAESEEESRNRSGIRFGFASNGGLYASILLLGIAGVMIAFFVWAYLTPQLVPPILFFISAGTAIVALIAYMVLRRTLDGEVDVLADVVRVRIRRRVRSLRWSEVSDWRIRGRTLTLFGPAGRLRLSTRRRDFVRLCEQVARRVVASRQTAADSGPIDPSTGWRAGSKRAPAQIHGFRRSRTALVFAAFVQLAMVVAGAYGSVELYVLGMIGLGITAWKVARTPFAVTVGLRWIRILRPTGTESILLSALSGVDVAVAGDFVVLVYNRFGEPRIVPAVDGNVLGLHDAIAANLDAVEDSAAAASIPAPRARRRLRVFRPAVAAGFAALLYLPIVSGLVVSEVARTGSIPAVRFLLAIGSPVDGSGVGGRTPLFRAATYGHAELVRLLVELGADPSYGSGPLGLTPLHVAAGWNHPDIVQYLLDLGVDPDIPNDQNQTPLYQASWQTEHGDNTRIARLLLDRGATVDARSLGGYTPLLRAIVASNEPLVELLVSRGADLEVADDEGSHALHTAAIMGDAPMVELLLRLGADIDARQTTDGRTALAQASIDRKLDVVRVLLAHGADPGIPDQQGFLPVHLLVMSGADAGTLKALLDHGADPNAVGPTDIRALPAAIMRHRTDLALVLLDAGADPNLAGGEWTPLRAAFRTSQNDMVDELYRRGAK